MNRRHTELSRVILVLMCMVAMSACAKKAVPVQTDLNLGSEINEAEAETLQPSGELNDPRWRDMGIFSEEELREFKERAQIFENEDVRFEYDSFILSDDAKKILERKIEFLRRYPRVRVTIEGHCDERGTNEYNLALGERRANSAWQYLVNSGIDPDSLSMISYGEERPIAFGRNESSMGINRRAHFVLYY